jgi:hypothetical protein
MRVKTYTASVYYKSTGSSMTKEYPFTEEHANEANAVLEVDGLNIEAARKLCNKWTRLGSRGDVIYRYWV